MWSIRPGGRSGFVAKLLAFWPGHGLLSVYHATTGVLPHFTMSNIRVYEAAKKMNMETKELMKLLNDRGVVIKSPIASISEENFNELLESITGAPAEEKDVGSEKVLDFAEKVAESKMKSITPQPSGEEKEKSKLALVPPLQSVKSESPEQADDEKDSVEPKPAPPPAAPAATVSEKKPGGASIISYLALGTAAIALLALLTISSNISDNSAGILQNSAGVTKALETSNAFKSELAAVKDGIQYNQEVIFDNQGSIADLEARVSDIKRAQIQIDLSKQSAALEELAPAFDGDISKKLLDISKGLSSLATSI